MEQNAKSAFLDSLHRLGLNPTNVKAQTKEGEGQEERLVYPGALVQYKDRVIAIDLLQGQSSVDGINSLNNAEALLEYKFARAISRLINEQKPNIAYATGNGEPVDVRTYDLVRSLQKEYNFFTFDLDRQSAIPSDLHVLVIVKPTATFTEAEKIKIDQYVMHGGKVVWMTDRLYAEMDSLQRVQNDFIAFDRGLNLDDLLFKYGVRINPDLVQSLNADKFGMVVGDMGGKPQMDLLPWPYFPLLQNNSGHPIAKNLDYITSQFPHSIDTVQAEGIRKTILLTTAPESRILNTPAKVMLQSIKTEEDLTKFNQGSVPIAVLLEGKFSSLYTNRLSPAVKDSIGFLPADSTDNKMIVIADGDIALNTVSQNEGPLPMGMNMFTKYQYANREFILNCLEYLTDTSGILETRSKDYTLRLLDKKKIAEQKSRWQIINILAPILLVILFGISYQLIRKNRYRK
jgi:gliding-associated putative ABC transporter substrate-binding component GldG